jgi:excisionase family DNA binding protein
MIYLAPHHEGGGAVPDYPVLTAEEAAELSGFHIDYIRRLARSGKIKAEKHGVWLIDRDDLNRYLEEMKALGADKHNWRRRQEEV